MNADSRSGNAPGFRLSSLNKLVDTKSADNSMTLLHFVASIAESKLKDALTLTDELADCEGPTKRTRRSHRVQCGPAGCPLTIGRHALALRARRAVTYTAVQADIFEVKNGVKFVENELKNHTNSPPGDNFKPVMTISA